MPRHTATLTFDTAALDRLRTAWQLDDSTALTAAVRDLFGGIDGELVAVNNALEQAVDSPWITPPATARELLHRAGAVASSITDTRGKDEPGVSVEIMETHPFAVRLGRVTAVGFKYGDVLLTVEPQP